MTWPWCSPVDRAPLRQCGERLVDDAGLQQFSRRDGIWQLVHPERQLAVEQWARDYGRLRAAEGRRAADADYYRSLPWRDVTGRFSEQWSQRAASFEMVLRELDSMRPGRVVDLGAGNGWAAARLVERGWDALAVDVNTDDDDGLGAAHHHGIDIELARAELGSLPLENSSVDAVLINAALHYAADPIGAVADALRVVRPGGMLFVVDSPVFVRPAAGDKMVAEQHDRLLQMHGVVAPLAGRGFLLRAQLAMLPHVTGGRWRDLTVRPTPARRLVGRARARRETATLCRLVAHKSPASEEKMTARPSNERDRAT